MITLTVIYVVFSLTLYLGMFVWLSKLEKTHPEMRKVKPNEPLLVVKFNGPSRASSPEQHLNLGFNEFLANNPPGDGNTDGP